MDISVSEINLIWPHMKKKIIKPKKEMTRRRKNHGRSLGQRQKFEAREELVEAKQK